MTTNVMRVTIGDNEDAFAFATHLIASRVTFNSCYDDNKDCDVFNVSYSGCSQYHTLTTTPHNQANRRQTNAPSNDSSRQRRLGSSKRRHVVQAGQAAMQQLPADVRQP